MLLLEPEEEIEEEIEEDASSHAHCRLSYFQGKSEVCPHFAQ